MEQIKIIFFALTSFFTIENGLIVADNTTVTIDPENKEIEIIQNNLFTVIQSEKDRKLVLEQWDKLLHWQQKNASWSPELDSFSSKDFNIISSKETLQPRVVLRYSEEKDLRTLGIWYHKEKNQFSINQIPQHNIKTNNGKLEGNYWVFKADEKFSFSLEPFLEMPENYKQFKKPLESIVLQKK